MDFKEELTKEIKEATRKVLEDLFSNGEQFYYITLVTDGMANTPCISGWSVEALHKENEDDQYYLKWSYADSPYCCWKQEYYEKVEQMLINRKYNDLEYDDEYKLRLSAMENAMIQLDAEGLFSVNQNRDDIIVLVEVMPPDYTNTERAYRMNSKESKIFNDWIEEASEE